MRFPVTLTQGILLKRYKRFLADIQLPDGTILTAHCPNTGSMKGCSTPGSPVCLSRSDNPKRKYPHTLEMVRENNTWIGVNTARTNNLVAEAIETNTIKELQDIDSLQREVKTSEKSRLDILVTRGEEKIYIEVKNCSLVENGCAMFPDAVTARGTKHLLELADLVRQGHQAIIFYLVQRLDAHTFQPAHHIDPLYSETLADVMAQGVQVLVYQAAVSPEGIEVVGGLPCTHPGQREC